MPPLPVCGMTFDSVVDKQGLNVCCGMRAHADKQDVRQRLNLRWGVMPFRLDFDADPEENVDRTFALLKRRDLVRPGDLVVVVSDIRPPDEGVVRSVQIRHVP